MQNSEALKDAVKGYDSARFNCLAEYKNGLKSSVLPVQTMYEGYLKNFNADGTLVKQIIDGNEKDKSLPKLGSQIA